VFVRPILFASKTAATPAAACANDHDFSACRGKGRTECGNGVYLSNCAAAAWVRFVTVSCRDFKWQPATARGSNDKVTKLLLSLVASSQENQKKDIDWFRYHR
jgi:hypothetical protein